MESSRGAHGYPGGKNRYGREGRTAVSPLHFTTCGHPAAPQMSNTAHRGERGDAQNPAHVMPQVLQNMV